jgi:hypothetical protein
MRETTAAMDNGGCWCLMMAINGKMKIAYNGVGDGQQRGGGQTVVQCRRWVGTVRWRNATAVARTTAMLAEVDNGGALDNGGGQWVFNAVMTRQQCLTAVAVVVAVAAKVTWTVQWQQR